MSVVCCRVESSAAGWSLVRRSPTDCGVSDCDRKAIQWRLWPTGGLFRHGKTHLIIWRNKNHYETEHMFLLYSSDEDV